MKHRTYNAPAIEQSVEFNHVQGVVVVGVIVQVDLVIDLFQRPARDVLTVCRENIINYIFCTLKCLLLVDKLFDNAIDNKRHDVNMS